MAPERPWGHGPAQVWPKIVYLEKSDQHELVGKREQETQ